MTAQKRMYLSLLVVLVSGLLATSLQAEQLALPSADLIAPDVTLLSEATSVRPGENFTLKVLAKDNVGVKSVVLFYRSIGSQNYIRKTMFNDQGDQYSIELTAKELAAPGIEYYIQAEDLSGNTLLHGYSFSPMRIAVQGTSDNPAAVPAATLATTPATSTNTVESKGVTLLQNNSSENAPKSEESIFKNKWLWIGVGIAAAAIAASGGSDSGGQPSGGGTAAKPTTINFTAPATP